MTEFIGLKPSVAVRFSRSSYSLWFSVGAKRPWRNSPKLALPVPATPPHPVEGGVTRNVYPLSVIYGGAYSGEELVRARKVDAVVARHYAGFGSASVSRMPKDAAYVCVLPERQSSLLDQG